MTESLFGTCVVPGCRTPVAGGGPCDTCSRPIGGWAVVPTDNTAPVLTDAWWDDYLFDAEQRRRRAFAERMRKGN